MADLATVEAAFLRAHQAGDVQSAGVLAGEVRRLRAAQPAPTEQAPESTKLPAERLMQNLVGGAIGGAGGIGSAIVELAKSGPMGEPFSTLTDRVKARNASVEGVLSGAGVETDSGTYGVGKFATQIAGTAGVGPLLAGGVKALPVALPRVVNALTSGGFTTGGAATGLAGRAGDVALRAGAGAAVGGASTALTDPGSMDAGAGVGAGMALALPPVLRGGAAALEFGANKVIRPVSNLFTEAGPMNIARNYLNTIIGEGNLPAVLARTKNAPELVQGSKPTVGEALAGLPEGSPVNQLQTITAKTPGGPSALFGRRVAEQEAAIEAAKVERKLITDPMRKTALDNANIAGVHAPELARSVNDKFASKAGALQTKGRLDTFAAEQTYLANNWTPIPGYPQFPGRYAPHMENLPGAKAGASVAQQVAAQRQAEKLFNQYKLDSLSRHGYFPLETEALTDGLSVVMKTPGNRTNTTLQKALGEIQETIKRATNEHGVIDSRDLYTIRKLEAGNVIDKYAKENQNWDKKFTAGLLHDVQHAIDEAIEKAGGSGWKDYLGEYTKRSAAIDADLARRELAGSVLQPTNLAGGLNISEQTRPHSPNWFNPLVTATNYALKALSKNVEPKVDAALTRILLDPSKFTAEMSKLPPKTRLEVEALLRKGNLLQSGAAVMNQP